MEDAPKGGFTPLSSARRSRLTPLRRRSVLDDLSVYSSTQPGRLDTLAQACDELDAEIKELQDDGMGLGDEASDANAMAEHDVLNRLALLADKVTRRRLDRVSAVTARLDALGALRARVNAARDAAQPELSKAERQRRLDELGARHQALVADILAASEHAKALETRRDATAAETVALKAEYERTKKADEERLGFYAYLTKLMMDVTNTRITAVHDENSDGKRFRGFVMRPDRGDVVNFDIDPSRPQQEIAAEMWGYLAKPVEDNGEKA